MADSSRFISEAQLAKEISVSIPVLRLLIMEGDVPGPIEAGDAIGQWDRHVIRQWMENLPSGDSRKPEFRHLFNDKPADWRREVLSWPRFLDKELAAYYVGITDDSFDTALTIAGWPQGQMIEGKLLWDRRELDDMYD